MRDDTFPTIAQAVLLILALMCVEYFFCVVFHDLRGLWDASPRQTDAFIAVLGYGVLFTVLLGAKSMSYRNLFHPSKASVGATILMLGVPVAMLVPSLVLLAGALEGFLQYLLPLSEREAASFAQMRATDVATIVSVCVLAPFLEEMLFRGIILRSFLLQYPKGLAIGASALIFGAAHLNLYQFVAAFGLGLLSAWLYERSRSLIPCIVLHLLYNSAVMWVSADTAADAAPYPANVSLEVWVASIALGLVGLVCLCRALGVSRNVFKR